VKPSNYKVLVVDDDEAMRNLIVTVLSTPGHHCVAAIDGNDALDKANKNKFDAVITDIVMPGMDGITLTKEVLRQYPNLPIMVLTESADQSSPASAVSAGAREFIRKPFSVVEFTIRFHKMMRDHEFLREMIAAEDEILFNLRKGFEGKMEGFEADGLDVTISYTGQA
jgi:CheY-like chemotaxis protein